MRITSAHILGRVIKTSGRDRCHRNGTRALPPLNTMLRRYSNFWPSLCARALSRTLLNNQRPHNSRPALTLSAFPPRCVYKEKCCSERQPCESWQNDVAGKSLQVKSGWISGEKNKLFGCRKRRMAGLLETHSSNLLSGFILLFCFGSLFFNGTTKPKFSHLYC